MLGTPHYLSPEQALGEPATGASDLYALGVVAHEMLTGRRPFDKGTPVATALAQVHEPPPPLPPHVPRGCASLIERCLEKTPDRRSARETGEPRPPEDDLPEAPARPGAGSGAAAEARPTRRLAGRAAPGTARPHAHLYRSTPGGRPQGARALGDGWASRRRGGVVREQRWVPGCQR